MEKLKFTEQDFDYMFENFDSPCSKQVMDRAQQLFDEWFEKYSKEKNDIVISCPNPFDWYNE